jgi:hypothetical protein
MTESKTEKKQKAPAEKVKEKTEKVATAKSEPKYGYWWGTGRRKSSVARVRIKPGQGKLLINKREFQASSGQNFGQGAAEGRRRRKEL